MYSLNIAFVCIGWRDCILVWSHKWFPLRNSRWKDQSGEWSVRLSKGSDWTAVQVTGCRPSANGLEARLRSGAHSPRVTNCDAVLADPKMYVAQNRKSSAREQREGVGGLVAVATAVLFNIACSRHTRLFGFPFLHNIDVLASSSCAFPTYGVLFVF